MKRKWMVRGAKIALFGTIGVGLFGTLVMELWNWLMPNLFGLQAIGFWQALGLMILGRILFGGFRGPSGLAGRRRMMDRWGQMTPEERAKFRQGMRSRCGQFEAPGPEPQTP